MFSRCVEGSATVDMISDCREFSRGGHRLVFLRGHRLVC